MKESERVAAYLKKRDAPCPGCGRNLRGVVVDRCPSCDETLTVVKVIYHAPRASWASLAFGYLGLAAGVAVVVGVWPIVMTLKTGRGDPLSWDHVRLMGVVGATMGVIAAAYAWNEWADEMTQRPARFRWGWAAACWGAAPAVWLVGRAVGRW